MRRRMSLFVTAGILLLLTASCGREQPSDPTLIAAGETTTPEPTLASTSTTVPTATPTMEMTATPTWTATTKPTSTPTEAPAATETASPTASPVVQGVSVGATCRESVDGIRALTKDLGLPDHLLQDNPARTSDDFDVNSYFSTLDHLAMAEGYALDFVYYYDDLGGKPLVYQRPAEQTPYATYSEFIDAAGGASVSERSYGPLEHAHDYLEYIETDDSPDGYLQFVLLAIQGDQFYLYWHGLYHDEMILCDVSDVQKTAAEVEGFDLELPEDIIAQAEKLDFEPTVHLDEETATVRFVLFTKWGGFVEVWWTITREFPHKLVDGGSELLIEYDCGIAF